MKTNSIFHEYGNNPLALFDSWYKEAERSETVDFNAMAIATAGRDGRPHVRLVLLRHFSEDGFVFFTNYESAKGRELAGNPYAEANFYWKSLGRQVRIAGAVEKISGPESDDYFKTRERGKQVGAWASLQSESAESYEALEARVKDTEARFAGQDIPRPPHWGGYSIIPERIEFWVAETNRLHTRFAYIKNKDGNWQVDWLFP